MSGRKTLSPPEKRVSVLIFPSTRREDGLSGCFDVEVHPAGGHWGKIRVFEDIPQMLATGAMLNPERALLVLELYEVLPAILHLEDLGHDRKIIRERVLRLASFIGE